MKAEIEALTKRQTWEVLPRSSVSKGDLIVPGTLVFKCNRRLDGSFQKFKSRRVRDDVEGRMSEGNINTYSPVIQYEVVINMAQTMMLHAAMRSPQGYVRTEDWPMAMDHAVWIYNHLPRMDSGASPEELWTRSNTVTSRLLSDCHVWGSPTYVLEPKLHKSGVKIPKWRPRSRRGVNMGFSPRHSTMVALVLNLVTSTVTPQFHVVFDDMFSAATWNDPSEIWG